MESYCVKARNAADTQGKIINIRKLIIKGAINRYPIHICFLLYTFFTFLFFVTLYQPLFLVLL